MKAIEISNVQVKFPFEPYTQQYGLMEALIRGAQESTNTLIDSPTGTGKTLCLLTAMLGWLEAYKAFRKASLNPEYDDQTLRQLHLSAFGRGIPYLKNRDLTKKIPTIYYSSRTHSQLSQCILEIKNTAYKPLAVTLGSRDQMCINPTVTHLPAGAKTSACRALTAKQQCTSFTGSENPIHKLTDKLQVMDIEDLITYGTERHACPYYLSTNAQPSADIVFLPYNYLIDSVSRKSQKIDLDNAIVIFDEGHNMESSCQEACSFEITVKDLEGISEELEHVINVLTEFLELQEQSAIKIEAVKSFQEKIEKLMQDVKRIGLSTTERNCNRNGDYIYTLFGMAGFIQSNYEETNWIIEHCIKLLGKRRKDYLILAAKHSNTRKGRLRVAEFSNACRILFESPLSNDPSLMKFFKVNIQEQKVVDLQFGTYTARTLSLWCFSSEVAMKELAELNPRSIILASGTLAPLDTFALEMGLPFPNRIENTHVIDDSQIFVAATCRGPASHVLKSTFDKRDDAAYISDLGNSIVNIANTVPGGILVFFTSYAVLQQTVEKWKKCPRNSSSMSIWSRIEKSKKAFVEPKSKADFASTIHAYENQITAQSGAIFFAVCKGKASEGIDFSDSKARAVVMCGIPFPNTKDSRVAIKKEMLNGSRELSRLGDLWYQQQAHRAVNQAIGRAIRHRNDFGAIILLDTRFSESSVQKNLPIWVRNEVNNYHNFGRMHDGLKKFFDYHKSDGTKGDKKLLQRVKADPSLFDTDRPDPLQVRPRVNLTNELPLQIKRSTSSSDVLQVKRHAVEFEDPLKTQSRVFTRDPLALKSLDMKLKSSKDESKPIKVVFTSSKNPAFNPYHIDKPNCKPLPNFADSIRNAVAPEPLLPPTEMEEVEIAVAAEPPKPNTSKPDPKPFMAKLKTILTPEQYSTIKDAIRLYKERKYTQKNVIGTFVNSIFDEERRFREVPERKARWEIYQAYREFVSSKYIDYYQNYLEKFKEDVFTEVPE